MRRLALLLALWAAPAFATVDAWPALYDVAGVAADDMLNIRSGPGTGHAVIGTLAPDARGVEVLEMSRDGGWGRVNAGEGSGWAALAFLERRPGQWHGAVPPVSACFGTEPFWRLETGEDWRMDTPEGTVFAAPAPELAGSLSHRGRFAGSVAAEGATWVLTLANESCSDGMSSRRYGWQALLVRAGAGTELWSGCCTLAE
ncbi:SH3 domain-containing protein [Limimaricola pyoseonensis]|uniref:SH3 domain-containing protein n=1 Tax=Limimaricola pyoseonensis TaxID=521013 RepID=A0A1G7ESN5_9RHOB|nr:SH3 domain-containing protein [Limimaricola pyoseonensis]SDE66639.1 SH3 domain-containing protein [Limimaricola pyoseonensis]